MSQLVKRPQPVVDEDDIKLYAGMYVMKMMDLKPEDGGMIFPLGMPSDLTPLDEILHELASQGLVQPNQRKGRWELTKAGIAHLAKLIQEAEDLMDEFDDAEVPEVVAELRGRNLDLVRARFLWGWFDGEFDDLVDFQRQRGVRPVQTLWAYYLTDEAFYAEIAKDLEEGADGTDPGADRRDDRRDDDDDLD
jgi:hypothetical protein